MKMKYTFNISQSLGYYSFYTYKILMELKNIYGRKVSQRNKLECFRNK